VVARRAEDGHALLYRLFAHQDVARENREDTVVAQQLGRELRARLQPDHGRDRALSVEGGDRLDRDAAALRVPREGIDVELDQFVGDRRLLELDPLLLPAFPGGRLGRVLVVLLFAVEADVPVRSPGVVALLHKVGHVLLHRGDGLQRSVFRAFGVEMAVDDHPVVRPHALAIDLERPVPGAFGMVADVPADRLDRIQARAGKRQLEVDQDLLPEMPVPALLRLLAEGLAAIAVIGLGRVLAAARLVAPVHLARH
jgi:hypothetical protein